MRLTALALALLLAPAFARADPPSEVRLDALRARLARAPADAPARLELADALIRRGQPREALAEIDLLEAVQPVSGGDARALVRARALEALERDVDAIEVLSEHVRASGGSVAAHWLLALLLERRGRLVEASADYDAALALGGGLEVHLARGRVVERLGDLDEAARGYERALRSHAGAAVLRVELVRVERARGNAAGALPHADALVGAAQVAPRWRVLRADILAELGREDEARAERTRALADAERMLARRRSALALLERGRARLALGRREEAIADLEQALRRAPRLAEASELLLRAEGGAR